MNKIDAFAHILTPNFYNNMLEIVPDLEIKFPYMKNKILIDVQVRRESIKKFKGLKQIVSMINLNPEDFVDKDLSFELCWKANEELINIVKENNDIFVGAVAMLPLNNIEGSIKIIREQVISSEQLLGVQLFSKSLGNSIASDKFLSLFEEIYKNNISVWLHPVFDINKKDNNLIFSWEYEQSQAMLEIIMADIFVKYPKIKILCHHAGAMVPFFSKRLPLTMPAEKYSDMFKLFYVDTAILGNTLSLEMALDYYGTDRLIFATDAPLGILPDGPTEVVIDSVECMKITGDIKEKIYKKNIEEFLDIKF